MSTVQAIDSADSLVPNGNFCHGLAYWSFYPPGSPTGEVARHKSYYTDGQSNVPTGTPKYGLETNYTSACWLDRQDLFEYPVRRYLTNMVAFPVSTTALKIVATDGTFHVESLDYGTPYDASFEGSVLSFGLGRSVPMPNGTKLLFVPVTGSEIIVQTTGEITAPGSASRSFSVDATVPDADGILYFYVKKAPEKGSTVVLDAADSTHSGYYSVDRVDDTFIRILPQSGSLSIKAQSGDVTGILYNRDQGVLPDVIRMRVFGDLTLSGVSVGDYFVTTAPARSYGKILSISSDSVDPNLQLVSVEVSDGALPYTSTGQFVAVTAWAVSAQVNANIEISIPAVRYNLTLAFTTNFWSSDVPSLAFVKEEGLLTDESFLRDDLLIEDLPATFVRSFPATDQSSLFTRYIFKIQYDRAVPIPGVPALRFLKSTPGTKTQLSHVALFKGDLTETVPSDDQQTSLDFDTLEYNTSPDGGVIQKGTVMPFVGGTCCPPGWKRVYGEPADGDVPSTIVRDIPEDLIHKMEVTYNYGSDITTVKMTVPEKDESGFTLAEQTGCGYNPWSNYRNMMTVKMRPPPNPPVMKLQFRNPFTGRKITWFRARLPEPPARPQRYAFVEVGLLKNILVPGQILELIPDSSVTHPFDASFEPVIGAVRVSGGFVAEESDWQTKSYPSSYETLFAHFNIWSVVPSPLAILSLISAIRDIMRNMNALRAYDPTEHGEPLPPVQATSDNTADEVIEMDLGGDWREALTRCKDNSAKAIVRILQTGYVKNSSVDAGRAGNGAPEHNHKVRPSPDVDTITGVAASIDTAPAEKDRPPIAVNHGHDYLGAGGYSRPKGRGVLMCIKL